MQKKIVGFLLNNNDKLCNLASVAKKLKITQQNLTYYSKELRVHKVIRKLGLIWEVDVDAANKFFLTKKTPSYKAKSDKVVKTGTCRTHYYGMTLFLPFELDEKTRESLAISLGLKRGSMPKARTTSKGFFWQASKYSTGFFWNGWRILLSKSTLYAQLNKEMSFFSEDAQANDFLAIDTWMQEVVKSLEASWKKRLYAKGEDYAFKCSTKHHARVNNALARIRRLSGKEPLKVYSKEGILWRIHDDSFGNDESECIYAPTATPDDEKTSAWDNGIREHPETITVGEILQLQKHNALQIQEAHKNLDYYAENMVSHVGAVQEIAATQKLLSKTISSLETTVSRNKLSVLDTLKQQVKSKDDVVKFAGEIESLTVQEKFDFTLWLMEAFD